MEATYYSLIVAGAIGASGDIPAVLQQSHAILRVNKAMIANI
jgi:hypothetical protein